MNSTILDASTATWPYLKDNLLSDSSPRPRKFETNSSIQPQWEDTAASLGLLCGSLGSDRCWEVAGPALHVSKILLRDISEALNQHSDYLHNVSILFSITFGLFMIGRSEHNAHPTLIISSERELTRIRCLNIVGRSGILTRYPGVLLGSSSHSPIYKQPVQSRDPSVAADSQFVFFSPPVTNNVCGRSIHIMERTVPGNLCPMSIRQKATIGGFIRLRMNGEDELYCGLTVAHTFIDESLLPLQARWVDFALDTPGLDTTDGLGDITMHGGPDSHPTHPVEHRSKICDMIKPLPKDRTYLGSVKDMSRVGIGSQLASSLNGQHPDLDWALIEIQHPHYQSANITSIDWVTGQCQLYVEQIVPTIQETVSVLVITSIGARTAFLSASSTYYKSPQGASSEEVYIVRLDGTLESGDVGSWVIDPETGDLYGHIIAIFPESRISYLVPAYRIFSDIKEQLGGTVELAGRKRSAMNQAGTLLGMNQNDESVIRQMQMSSGIFAEMAAETELMYQALIVNPSNLKQYLKKTSPYSWHDISDKAKYEAMIRLGSVRNMSTQPYWQKGQAEQGGVNYLARWFLFRRFRLAGTSRQKSFGRAHPEDLNLMFAPSLAS